MEWKVVRPGYEMMITNKYRAEVYTLSNGTVEWSVVERNPAKGDDGVIVHSKSENMTIEEAKADCIGFMVD